MKRQIRQMAVCLVFMLCGMVASSHAGRTENFLQNLYRRFAYRQATPGELRYWAPVVERLSPEKAETRLKHWFFVHAVYKTSLGRNVTIEEVEQTVDLLDAGVLDYRAVQFSVFQSPEYQRAKQQGRAGTMMIPGYSSHS